MIAPIVRATDWHVAHASAAKTCDVCGCRLYFCRKKQSHRLNAQEGRWEKRGRSRTGWIISPDTLGTRRSDAGKARGPREETRQKLIALARLRAAGLTLTAAAEKLGGHPATLKWMTKKYREFYQEQYEACAPPDEAPAVDLSRRPESPAADDFLSVAQLAAAFGVPRELLKARLRNFRARTAEGWKQVSAGKFGGTIHLYRVGDVLPQIHALREPDPRGLGRETITADTQGNLSQAAARVARGLTLSQAADELGISFRALRWQIKHHRQKYNAELARARAAINVGSPIVIAAQPQPDQPRKSTIKALRRAAAMLAKGATMRGTTAALNLRNGTLKHLVEKYPKQWKAAYDQASKAAGRALEENCGTDAVFENPAGHVRMARRYQRWIARKGEAPALVPGEIPTLSSFYRDYFAPVRLSEVSPPTIAQYQGTLRYWIAATSDPSVDKIDGPLLAKFRDFLKALPGREPGSKLSAQTVRTRLRSLQCILDRLGPPSRGLRDAAGVLQKVPYVKPPRVEEKEPRAVPLERIGEVYRQAATATVPRIAGLAAADFWQSLIAVALLTALRRRTLFKLRFQYVDWEARCLRCPAGILKARKAIIVPLHPIAFEHLRRIQGDRDMIFPWPQVSMKTFYDEWHRLQTAADIARADHFGLHGLRRTAATLLYETSPHAAQLLLGHAALSTTERHYVASGGILERAVNAMVLPDIFRTNPPPSGDAA